MGLKKELSDVLFPDDVSDILQRLFWKFKAASGIDDFQNTEFSGDVGEHFTVQCEHAFFVSGIVIDVIAEPAFAPDAWIGFQQDDFPLVFIGNFTITIHNFFVLSLVLPAWKLAALQVPVQTGTT